MRPAEKEGQSQVAEREVVRENLGSSQAGFRLHPRLLSTPARHGRCCWVQEMSGTMLMGKQADNSPLLCPGSPQELRVQAGERPGLFLNPRRKKAERARNTRNTSQRNRSSLAHHQVPGSDRAELARLQPWVQRRSPK